METKKKFPKGFWINILCGLSGIALCVYVWISSAKFPEDKFNLIDSAYFPRLLSIGLLIFSLSLLFVTLILRKDEEMEPFVVKNRDTQKAIAMFFITVVYCVLLKPIGFILVTLAYLFGTSVMLGNRKWVSLTISSVAFTGVVYWMFKYLLGIALPQGLLRGII